MGGVLLRERVARLEGLRFRWMMYARAKQTVSVSFDEHWEW